MSTLQDRFRGISLFVATLLLATTACCSASVQPAPVENDSPAAAGTV